MSVRFTAKQSALTMGEQKKRRNHMSKSILHKLLHSFLMDDLLKNCLNTSAG